MAVVNINTIKNWFKTGMIPTQAQFWSVFDSYRHKNDNIPVAEVEGINELLATRASQQVLDNHLAQKGAPNGYAPLDEFTKLAAQYLNIVNDLVTGGATALLSAEQGKVLQTQVNAINTLLTSDNVNLDTVQELVDAIETVQLSLSSILVNDLTTGGTTKALTAEMGKQLDLIKESTANKSTSVVVDYLSNIKFPSVKAVYDFCMSAFKKKFLSFGDVTGIAHTFGEGSENTMYKFSNNNPITATIPTNATTPFEIGTVFETIAIGNGVLTVTGALGVTILTNLSNTSVKNEVRRYTKIDTDTWTVEGTEVSLTKAQTFSQGLKTFLNGMFGMRNVANTFTSFFSNSTTQSRTWTFPDKSGTVAMTSDIIAQLNGTVNRLVKFGTATTGANSRIEDTGTYVGIGTVNSPKKDITLGNQANREIGIEDSSSSAAGKALIMRAGRTINYALGENFNALVQPTSNYSGMASDSSNNIYVCVSPDIYKQTNSTGNFVSMSVNIPCLNAIAFHPNGNVYACCDNGQVRMQTAGIGAFNLIQTITNFLWGITVAPNGDVYVCSQNNDIWKQTGGSGVFVSLGQTSRSWRGISAAPNGDIYACVNGGDIYKQVGGIGNFLPLGQVSRTWWKVVAAPNGNIYACVNGGDIYIQTNGIGDFVALGQQNRAWYGIVANNFSDVYASVFGGDIYKQINYSLGLPDLDGGANRVIAGTGKGTGKSRVEFYTGQKTVSGTDMQVETLREYIDENGYHVYTSMPVYADNAAAIAGGLPVGCEYRTATGVKMIVY